MTYGDAVRKAVGGLKEKPKKKVRVKHKPAKKAAGGFTGAAAKVPQGY